MAPRDSTWFLQLLLLANTHISCVASGSLFGRCLLSCFSCYFKLDDTVWCRFIIIITIGNSLSCSYSSALPVDIVAVMVMVLQFGFHQNRWAPSAIGIMRHGYIIVFSMDMSKFRAKRFSSIRCESNLSYKVGLNGQYIVPTIVLKGCSWRHQVFWQSIAILLPHRVFLLGCVEFPCINSVLWYHDPQLVYIRSHLWLYFKWLCRIWIRQHHVWHIISMAFASSKARCSTPVQFQSLGFFMPSERSLGGAKIELLFDHISW